MLPANASTVSASCAEGLGPWVWAWDAGRSSSLAAPVYPVEDEARSDWPSKRLACPTET